MIPLIPSNTPITPDSFGVEEANTMVRIPKALFDLVSTTGVRDALGLYSLLEGAPSMFAGQGVDDANLAQAIIDAKAALANVLPPEQTKPLGPSTFFTGGAMPPPSALHKIGSKP